MSKQQLRAKSDNKGHLATTIRVVLKVYPLFICDLSIISNSFPIISMNI